MWDAVRSLPILDRQIITMHLEGLSAAEVSTVTGLSAIAIATRLTRIRQRLVTDVRGNEGDS
jgi:RNA polymerase sigma-70 factor (ECF subfamily)